MVGGEGSSFYCETVGWRSKGRMNLLNRYLAPLMGGLVWSTTVQYSIDPGSSP